VETLRQPERESNPESCACFPEMLARLLQKKRTWDRMLRMATPGDSGIRNDDASPSGSSGEKEKNGQRLVQVVEKAQNGERNPRKSN
jgi:hypothetical protein